MKNQISKLAIVALTGAMMAWNISCKDEDPTLSVDPDVKEVAFKSDGTATTTTFTVKTNQSPWKVASNKPWLTATPNEANNTFVLSAGRNTTTSPREEATVTVSAGSATPVQIKVSQEAGVSVNITAEVLKNTTMPFEVGAQIVDPSTKNYYVAKDWLSNEQGGKNGNVFNRDATFDHVLSIQAWWDRLVPSMSDGKLWQTVQLDAGEYRFDAYVFYSDFMWATSPSMVYAVVALGNEIPDTGSIQNALGSATVPTVGIGDNELISIDFTLTQAGRVSLGFVANLCEAEAFFSKVELWSVR